MQRESNRALLLSFALIVWMVVQSGIARANGLATGKIGFCNANESYFKQLSDRLESSFEKDTSYTGKITIPDRLTVNNKQPMKGMEIPPEGYRSNEVWTGPHPYEDLLRCSIRFKNGGRNPSKQPVSVTPGLTLYTSSLKLSRSQLDTEFRTSVNGQDTDMVLTCIIETRYRLVASGNWTLKDFCELFKDFNFRDFPPLEGTEKGKPALFKPVR